MKLYALKCNGGYVRFNNQVGFQLVAMEKASVFGPDRLSQVNEIIAGAMEHGMTNVRLVELYIIEKDLTPAEDLSQQLQEMRQGNFPDLAAFYHRWGNILLKKLRQLGAVEFARAAEEVREKKL